MFVVDDTINIVKSDVWRYAGGLGAHSEMYATDDTLWVARIIDSNFYALALQKSLRHVQVTLFSYNISRMERMLLLSFAFMIEASSYEMTPRVSALLLVL